MVISTRPLVELCPVQPAAMEGRQMVQWDKDSCGDAGFLKRIRTRMSRFRAKYNAVPEYLYLYYLYHTGRARMEPLFSTYRDISYSSLDNFLPLMQWRLSRLGSRHQKTITLNDNFGARPNPKVVEKVRGYLDKAYPNKSPFEM
jgi:hypothetical protein